MDVKEKALEELYYSPHTGFRSAHHLWEQTQENYPDLDISKYFVKKWLLKQDTFTRFKTFKRPSHFRHIIVRDFYQMQFDLAEMATRVTKEGRKENDLWANQGYKYILVGVEILSRYGWAIAQRTKSGKETADNMKIILSDFEKHFGRKLEIIQFDEGAEFENKDVLPLLAKEEIKQWKIKTPRKAAIVERLIRTIKAKLWKMFYANKDRIWYDKIESVMENYNNTPHRSIGMKPKDVNENNKYTVWGRLYGHEETFKKPKFNVGDRVRVLHLVKKIELFK